MSIVQYSWLDVFRHIVYSPEVYIRPSLLAQSKLHILTSNNFHKGMSTAQHSSLAAVRRILAGLLEYALGKGNLGDFSDFLATLVPGDLLFDRGDLAALRDLLLCRGDLAALGDLLLCRGDLAALGDLLLCRGDWAALGDLLLALGDLFAFFTMCSEVP